MREQSAGPRNQHRNGRLLWCAAIGVVLVAMLSLDGRADPDAPPAAGLQSPLLIDQREEKEP